MKIQRGGGGAITRFQTLRGNSNLSLDPGRLIRIRANPVLGGMEGSFDIRALC